MMHALISRVWAGKHNFISLALLEYLYVSVGKILARDLLSGFVMSLLVEIMPGCIL